VPREKGTQDFPVKALGGTFPPKTQRRGRGKNEGEVQREKGENCPEEPEKKLYEVEERTSEWAFLSAP